MKNYIAKFINKEGVRLTSEFTATNKDEANLYAITLAEHQELELISVNPLN